MTARIGVVGSDAVMVSRVGDDLFEQNTLSNFRDLGVDARYVRAVPGTSSGVAPIFVEPGRENRILIVKSANDRLLPEDFDEVAEAEARTGAGAGTSISTATASPSLPALRARQKSPLRPICLVIAKTLRPVLSASVRISAALAVTASRSIT
jgi:sugar/nucleoside kinase (ribokinase family)